MAARTKEDFKNYLDDIYNEVQICGYGYSVGRAFELVDPIAFKCAYDEWLDSQDHDYEREYPDVDFDTLPEEVEDFEIQVYEDVKNNVLADLPCNWDMTAVTNGKHLVTLIDSSNMDEYEFDDVANEYIAEDGHRCKGCVDYTLYEYTWKGWDEMDSAVYEYYANDTLATFLERNLIKL